MEHINFVLKHIDINLILIMVAYGFFGAINKQLQWQFNEIQRLRRDLTDTQHSLRNLRQELRVKLQVALKKE